MTDEFSGHTPGPLVSERYRKLETFTAERFTGDKPWPKGVRQHEDYDCETPVVDDGVLRRQAFRGCWILSPDGENYFPVSDEAFREKYEPVAAAPALLAERDRLAAALKAIREMLSAAPAEVTESDALWCIRQIDEALKKGGE